MQIIEAILLVRFLTTSEGGRSRPINSKKYGCPLLNDANHGFDCRFVLSGETVFELGNTYEISVRFLDYEGASRNLKEGDKISLWEGKIIGEGYIQKLFDDSRLKMLVPSD